MSKSSATEPTEPLSDNSLHRSITRLHDRALRLTRPGPNWLAASVKIGLALLAISVGIAVPVVTARLLLGEIIPDGKHRREGWLLFEAVLLAPVVETGMLVLLHRITRRRLGVGGFVLQSAALFGPMHLPNFALGVPQTALFLIMAYQHVSFREVVGAGRAYVGVMVSHAVVNAVTSLAALTAQAILE